MSENTNKTPENEEIEDKIEIEDIKENKEDDKKFHILDSKSIQKRVIDNIKSFLSKIAQMQEKVRQGEKEEKKQKKAEKTTKIEEDEEEKSPKYLLEYYDLPFRYNETVVRVLAQTPKRLFVYWDVSDKDRQTYLKAFGENFFEDTYPILLVHNENKNYTVEVAINDFANSWYLDVAEPRDKYVIQLGRKFKNYVKPNIKEDVKDDNINLINDCLFIAVSNKLEVPNDHILFEEMKPHIKYRNVKTYKEEIKELKTSNYPKEVKKMYKNLYKDEIQNERYDMLNPSSSGTSSNVYFG